MEREELEDAVEGLEQQKENLERMTSGGNGNGAARTLTETRGVQTDAEAVVPGKRPDVLSALTTTQTTRLPDGTVTTKVVLKKRFADGREESSESVHTHHESVQAEMSKKETEKAESAKGKGWFWT